MKFVIYHTVRNQYFRAGASSPTWISDVNFASKFKTQKNAEDEISARKLFFQGFKEQVSVVELTETVQGEVQPVEDWETWLDKLIVVFEELKNYEDNLAGLNVSLNNELSTYDKMQEDLLHKIEFTPAVGVTSLRLMKQLRDVRVRRRKLKDGLKLLSLFAESDIINRVHNYSNEIENRTYVPRVLTELFEEEKK